MAHVVDIARMRLRAHIERAGPSPEELALLRAIASGTEVPSEIALARHAIDVDLPSSAMESLVGRGALTWIRDRARESIAPSTTEAGAVALARAAEALGPAVHR